MNNNNIILAILTIATLSAFAGDYDSVVDDSVVGYWRFRRI